jgi:hypothetical protein
MTVYRYCGRDFHEGEMALINRLIGDNPNRCRVELSRLICEALHWYKADGGLKAMSARVAMLRMQDDGLITLPPPRGPRPDPSVRLSERSVPGSPILQPAGALAPLTWVRVEHKADSSSFSAIITSVTNRCPAHNCVISSTRLSARSRHSALALPPGNARLAIDSSVGITNNASVICIESSTMLVS